jgi:ABC-type sugar transport system substrate-binding protein
MKKFKYVMSIPGDTMYLRAQTAEAQAAADRHGVKLEVVTADMDSVTQGQQLLDLIQSRTSPRLDGILVEPVSAAGLPRVAEAAVRAGIAWVVSNAQVDYVGTLRRTAKVPVFQISQDHLEVGRTQGRQIGAVLPKGGSVLYLRGPAMSWWATKRFEGMEGTKPKHVEVKSLKVLGSTAENACKAVSSWLSLSHARSDAIQLIMSQNADFVSGAKKAFEATTSELERMRWLSLPQAGVGLADRIKPQVDQGVLCAAVVTSLTMGRALEMLVRAMTAGVQPPEQTLVEAYSYPSLSELAKKGEASPGRRHSSPDDRPRTEFSLRVPHRA